jgi:hypothetical protein
MKARSEAMRSIIVILLATIYLEYDVHGQTNSEKTALDGMLLETVISPEQGERFQRAVFSGWLADPRKPVTAVIIHQHGCTNASPESHPPITGDFHWRALASKHDCLLLVPMYHVAGECSDWNDPESGSERALFDALADFSTRLGRPEIQDIPWVLWGHSGGSSWSAQMIVRHPHRTLAASFRGGCSKQFGVPEFRANFVSSARDLPMIFIWGKRESVPTSSHYVSWNPMNTMYRELREQGGKVCRVIDPGSEHGCDDSRLMSIPFFDAVLSGNRVQGTLVDSQTHATKDMNSMNKADPGLTWLPNEPMAMRWKEFCMLGTLKPQQPNLQAPILTALRQANGFTRLAWNINPALDGGLRAVRVYRDEELWKQIGIKSGALLATSRDSTPESLREPGIADESSEPHEYFITYLDNAGNESPRSEKVRSALP